MGVVDPLDVGSQGDWSVAATQSLPTGNHCSSSVISSSVSSCSFWFHTGISVNTCELTALCGSPKPKHPSSFTTYFSISFLRSSLFHFNWYMFLFILFPGSHVWLTVIYIISLTSGCFSIFPLLITCSLVPSFPRWIVPARQTCCDDEAWPASPVPIGYAPGCLTALVCNQSLWLYLTL